MRDNISEDVASSPTAPTEAIIAVGDAKKKRDVTPVDIPNEHTMISWDENEHCVVVRLQVKRVDVLYEVALNIYSEYLMTEEEAQDLVENLGGYWPSLQVRFCMYLQTVCMYLQNGGFHVNKISRKVVVNTIAWPHEEYEVVYGVGTCTMARQGQGKIHNYLIMTLDKLHQGEVQIDVKKWLDKIQAKIGDGIAEVENKSRGKSQMTKAPRDLFEANEECKKLRVQPDIGMTIGVLAE